MGYKKFSRRNVGRSARDVNILWAGVLQDDTRQIVYSRLSFE